MLRTALQEKQLIQHNLLKEIDTLRIKAKHTHSVQQASNLLKMDLQALQNDVQRLNKQKAMTKKQRQSLSEQLSQTRMQIKFLNQQLNSMKMYIDQLQHNLQKLSQEKIVLKNEMNLFKEQAQFCKRENIQQLGIVDHLERKLESTRQKFIYFIRKQFKESFQLNRSFINCQKILIFKGRKSLLCKKNDIGVQKQDDQEFREHWSTAI